MNSRPGSPAVGESFPACHADAVALRAVEDPPRLLGPAGADMQRFSVSARPASTAWSSSSKLAASSAVFPGSPEASSHAGA
jgi:hypothetical protein